MRFYCTFEVGIIRHQRAGAVKHCSRRGHKRVAAEFERDSDFLFPSVHHGNLTTLHRHGNQLVAVTQKVAQGPLCQVATCIRTELQIINSSFKCSSPEQTSIKVILTIHIHTNITMHI